MRCTPIYLLVLSYLFIAPPASDNAAAAGGAPSHIVAGFQSVLVAVMKEAETLSIRQRFERLAKTADESFHWALMAQITAGNHWKSATYAERRNLVEAFRRMSITTLATLFDSYSGEIFKVIQEADGPSRTRIVQTVLVKGDKSKVDILYVCRKFKVGWRMIDVILDNGISELKVRRSEYNFVLKKGGLPALIGLLNSKADELMSN